mmetsp:Transcript_10911/g.19587  ORF Transcript_10911/g.19587 Transcript_10911/m.19587 type:complete len:109 (+) Transcript_10911:247-573(+)
MDASALASLTPEQKQAVMAQAQQQANQQIMTAMVESMTVSCFDKCAGTSGDRLDSKEQGWYAFAFVFVSFVLYYLCCFLYCINPRSVLTRQSYLLHTAYTRIHAHTRT